MLLLLYGGIRMIFKRNEGFRLVFNEPIQSYFSVLVDGKAVELENNRIACEIIDISPHGIKMGSDFDLTVYRTGNLHIEVFFVIDEQELKGIGEIVWSKNLGNGYQYGVIFNDQPALEKAIVDQLKIRRRKETRRK